MNTNIYKFICIVSLVFITFFAVIYFIRKGLNSGAKNTFLIETPLEKYSKTMSSHKGFPFEIECDNQLIEITISDGFLFDDSEILTRNNNGKYETTCNKTIYWNCSIDENNVEEVNITFEPSNGKFKNVEFTLIRNNNYEYYLRND